MHIVKYRVRSADDWRAARQPDLAMGGLFIPTTEALAPGATVIVEVASPSLPNKVMIRAIVKSWRPALPRLRVRAGAVVEYDSGEAHKDSFVEDMLTGRRTAHRRRQSRLPIQLPATYRLTNQSERFAGTLSELSTGGANLRVFAELPIGTALTIDVVPPGAAAAMPIAAEVSYHHSALVVGVRFQSRDANGERRLREFMRRLKAS